MKFFWEAISDCGLIDLGFQGNPFMFSNRRKGILETKVRLDRAFFNHSWRTRFPAAQVTHLPCISSDNFILFIDLLGGSSRPRQRRTFRLEPMWLRSEGFMPLVNQYWDEKDHSSSSLVVTLRELGSKLTRWNSTNFGNAPKRIRSLKSDL